MKTTLVHARQTWSYPSVRFSVVFLVLLGAFWLAYQVGRPAFDPVQAATVWLVTLISNLAGLPASASAAVVSFGGGKFSFDVEPGCTGVAVAFMMSAAILAYPAPRKARLVGVLVAVPSIFVVNVVRLVTMGWAGVRSVALFNMLHLFAWQVMVVLLAGFGFYAWVRLNQRGGDKLRTVLLEIATAFGIFLAAFVPLWFIGVHGGITVYLLVFNWIIDVLHGVLGTPWVIPRSMQSLIRFGIYPYLTWAGFVSLFLATPRIGWRKRLRGAFFILTPLLIVPFALYVALLIWNVTPTQVGVGDVLFGFGAPTVVWLLWVRGSWKAPGKHACPACNERHDDIVEHVKTRHPIKTGKILAQLRREHPELEERDSLRG